MMAFNLMFADRTVYPSEEFNAKSWAAENHNWAICTGWNRDGHAPRLNSRFYSKQMFENFKVRFFLFPRSSLVRTLYILERFRREINGPCLCLLETGGTTGDLHLKINFFSMYNWRRTASGKSSLTTRETWISGQSMSYRKNLKNSHQKRTSVVKKGPNRALLIKRRFTRKKFLGSFG